MGEGGEGKEEEGWQEGLRGGAGPSQSLLEGSDDLYPGSSAPGSQKEPLGFLGTQATDLNPIRVLAFFSF